MFKERKGTTPVSKWIMLPLLALSATLTQAQTVIIDGVGLGNCWNGANGQANAMLSMGVQHQGTDPAAVQGAITTMNGTPVMTNLTKTWNLAQPAANANVVQFTVAPGAKQSSSALLVFENISCVNGQLSEQIIITFGANANAAPVIVINNIINGNGGAVTVTKTVTASTAASSAKPTTSAAASTSAKPTTSAAASSSAKPTTSAAASSTAKPTTSAAASSSAKPTTSAAASSSAKPTSSAAASSSAKPTTSAAASSTAKPTTAASATASNGGNAQPTGAPGACNIEVPPNPLTAAGL
ncbi:hypothetical protein HDU76_009918, partial [Blyttiomyces sp. JEL0837]